MNFFEKFFIYFRDENGYLNQFTDGLGHGFMDIRHLLWGLLAILLVILFWKLSKNHSKGIIKFFKCILIFMFFQRLGHQIVRTILGVEDPFWRAIFPIHLCSIMIYLLPIVVVFGIKKIKKPVYFLSILGGIITILDGDYFGSIFMNFGTVEGMFAHTILVIVPIILMHIEKERFGFKDIKNIFGALAIIATWSTIFNVILLKMGHNPNYLYLVSNMLPIGGKYFLYIYLLIFALVVFLTCLFSNIKNIKEEFKIINKNKLKILIYAAVVIAYTYLIIFLNNLFI